MFGRNRGMSAVIAACLMGAVSAGALAQPAPMVTQNMPKKAKRGLFGGYTMTSRTKWSYAGPGTTAAQIKRASKKARNVARHKKHAK